MYLLLSLDLAPALCTVKKLETKNININKTLEKILSIWCYSKYRVLKDSN
ncbi:MAG: hypothetical protein DMENIID0003_05840 [Wolbachia endosymbiont of Sergentomyia squamirostris]|uniref:Uncharacterized protein n=1 Tax=Wolbachia endosymbiont of Sergentomyia squamirostris TaxID=3113640 RepID=A0AAT9GCD4_9RICK